MCRVPAAGDEHDRRRLVPVSVGGIEVLITTQVYGLQMVTIPILASEHRADSLTVNHSRKVVAGVGVPGRDDTPPMRPANNLAIAGGGGGVADELDKLV
ncbi:hypothetical protein OIU92_05420 [Escherichia coli]|nr:hypothetical protein [Escherichia coli]